MNVPAGKNQPDRRTISANEEAARPVAAPRRKPSEAETRAIAETSNVVPLPVQMRLPALY
jgi:hypothetical protein